MPSRIHLAPTPLEHLIGRFGGRVVCGLSPGLLVRGLAAVHGPREGALSPLTRPEYVPLAREAVASGAVLVVAERLLGRLIDVPVWVHEDPARVCAELSEEATVDDTAGPWGEGCDVAPSAIVYPRVRLGKRVRIGPNAVIGAPGFGFRAGPSGLVHVPQLGGVVLEDDVWIGALSTVDSGALGPTRIRAGAKLDAQVHVGHNADVGKNAILCAQVGLAGSVVIGDSCILGGQVGVADHVRIGEGAKVAAKSGVIGDVPPHAVVAGYPAVGNAKWLRGLAAMYRMARRQAEPRTRSPK